MAVASALRRLLRVLEIEEEQARTELVSATAEHALIERRLRAALEQNRSGRLLVASSAQSGDLNDRWAGIEESRSADRRSEMLKPRRREAEIAVAKRRQIFLDKRVERRQAETLIEEAEAKEALEAGRRAQQGMDDWYLNRLHHIDHEAAPKKRDQDVDSQGSESVAKRS